MHLNPGRAPTPRMCPFVLVSDSRANVSPLGGCYRSSRIAEPPTNPEEFRDVYGASIRQASDCHHPSVWITIAAVSCVVAIAACGSSGGPISAAGTGSSASPQPLKFTDCMRSHGVPNFPDPTFAPGGYGVIISPAEQRVRDSPALLIASKECADVGTAIPGGAEAADLTTLGSSSCMEVAPGSPATPWATDHFEPISSARCPLDRPLFVLSATAPPNSWREANVGCLSQAGRGV